MLHLCARRGDAQRVELLVASGADLALQNSAGNTPLHIVVEESAGEPAMKEAFLEVCVVLCCCCCVVLLLSCVVLLCCCYTYDHHLFQK